MYLTIRKEVKRQDMEKALSEALEGIVHFEC